jgi:transcriptional regulator with XRE-family HTH domain
VPGLRREEVAHLAGVSLDYYARLEQGRQPTASSSVLDAVARALGLTEDERRHLHVLARIGHDGHSVGVPGPPAGPRIPHVMELVGTTPALLCDRHLDIVAANEAARFLFTDFEAIPRSERNGLRWILLSPRAKVLYGAEWESAASEMIGMLRLTAGGGEDIRFRQIVAELSEKSELFRRRWTEHQVSRWLHETKTLHLPGVGSLEFVNEFLSVQGMDDRTLVLVVPCDQTAFREAFDRLWSPAAAPGPAPAENP